MTSMEQRSNRTDGGFVLAIVLVCLTVIVLALTAMLGRMSQGHRQAVEREQYIQANWLAESALERAAAQLRRDSTYRGERWRIESDQLAGRGAVDVVIEIETPNSSLPATVRATVRNPNSSTHVIQKEKQWIVPVPEGGETP